MRMGSFAKVAGAMLCIIAVHTLTAKTIYVDASASGADDGSTWADAYVCLQDALAAAEAGDEIHVAQGAYTPDVGKGRKKGNQRAYFNLKQNVACLGGFPAGGGKPDARDPSAFATVLTGDLAGDDAEVITGFELLADTTRAENAFHVVRAKDVDSSTILDGFVIAGGNSSSYTGAGMRLIAASPTIRNCTFTENCGACGPAIFMEKKSSPTIDNCLFTLNASNGCCGAVGLRDSNPVFTNCVFSFNNAEQAGAVRCVYSKPVFSNCTFVGNRCETNGGAVECYASDAAFHRCRFYANFAEGDGGACFIHAADPTWTNCVFVGNACAKEGGAIGACQHVSNPVLINCTLTANTAKYYGGGLNIPGESKTTLINCIVWGNTDREGTGDHSQLQMRYIIAVNTCIQNLADPTRGTNIFGADPFFVSPPDDGGDGWADNPRTPEIDEGANDFYGDLRLAEGSCCIDAGTEETPELAGYFDIEGNKRVLGPRIHVGAIEVR